MCDRVLVLEKGRLNFDGDVDEGINYLQYDDDDESDEAEHATTSSAPTSDRSLSSRSHLMSTAVIQKIHRCNSLNTVL